MSAVQSPQEVWLQPMTEAVLDNVLLVERACYEHPWSRTNFLDSLYSGYEAQLLMGGPTLLGYFVAMRGVDEVHLLNITVSLPYQRQGWARVLLDALVLWARGQRAEWLWLEVRESNARAQALYERYGFRRIGERRNYYPAAQGQREHAIVMSLKL